ncbi:XkdX family protein [Bacillus sp. FJAT-49705]|uniref:XkdX family protein n=1 Tax=Cytobacillus citreus TaxID=2833586 RepID=A0ABS5NVV9_9BACI|nr:XkdX family protein [Cytobacillus citreus]MBS4188659.1 XkdX family protein [Cytobacillus citreus]MBS4191736.1 XkdX family protein [Cytobacillus citreus]
MDWFDFIKRYYNGGFYNNDPESRMYVGNFVKTGKITPEQFEEITGNPYPVEQEV